MRFLRTFRFWGLKKAIKSIFDEIVNGRYFAISYFLKPEYESTAHYMVYMQAKKHGLVMISQGKYNHNATKGSTVFGDKDYSLSIADAMYLETDTGVIVPQIVIFGQFKDLERLRIVLKDIEALNFWYKINCEWHP